MRAGSELLARVAPGRVNDLVRQAAARTGGNERSSPLRRRAAAMNDPVR
jgi:hypothetical protein